MLDFLHYKFLTVGRIEVLNYVTTPNFVAIGQTVVEISRFWILQAAGSRHRGFLKFYIINDWNGLEARTASACQIS